MEIYIIYTVPADKIEKEMKTTDILLVKNDDDNREDTQIINVVTVIILNIENLQMEDCLF